jgi:pimeloyl-ACP methyl ester carboxylesterase
MKTAFSLLIILILFLSGCGYMGMWGSKWSGEVMDEISPSHQRTQNISPEECSFISGYVRSDDPEKLARIPCMIAAYSDDHMQDELVDHQFLTWFDNSYYLYLPEGRFSILVFADLDGDDVFEQDEWVGRYGGSKGLTLEREKIPSGILEGIDIDVSFDRPRSWDSPVRIKAPARDSYVKSLDDPIFSYDVAELGVYSTPAFLKRAGQILYSDEPWDKDRIPIIFVHGVGGTPREWRYFAEGIDRKIYQPWFFYYPSGQGLDKASEAFYRFFLCYDLDQWKKVVITAHSMGGLVVRSAMNRYNPHPNNEILLITFATPYGGSEEAQSALESAPVVIPCWRDVADKSDFIQNLFNRKLPSNTEFYLFFAYRDDAVIKMGENTDGTITLKSQLNKNAQKEAEQVYGYDENHVSILTNKEALEQYNEILAVFAEK